MRSTNQIPSGWGREEERYGDMTLKKYEQCNECLSESCLQKFDLEVEGKGQCGQADSLQFSHLESCVVQAPLIVQKSNCNSMLTSVQQEEYHRNDN